MCTRAAASGSHVPVSQRTGLGQIKLCHLTVEDSGQQAAVGPGSGLWEESPAEPQANTTSFRVLTREGVAKKFVFLITSVTLLL